jgi:hypothetical protein
MKCTTVIGAAIAAVGLAACGSTAVPPTARPTLAPTVAATIAPALVPTPTATAVPTPAPEPPLALFYTGVGAMEVVSSQGVKQWGLTNAQEGQLFGLSAKQASGYNLGPLSGNSNLFFFYGPNANINHIVVLSRTGKLIGKGTEPANSGGFVNSPTGASWAWTIDQTPSATGQHHGFVEVGGIGQANRIVYHWVAPAGFTEQLDGWTNTGIILQRVLQGGPFPCGGDESSNNAWFAINPSTGGLTELASGNQQLMQAQGDGGAASSGVTVASLLNDAHSVLINGVRYSESKSIVAVADISPDGAHVGVLRESFNPCGGGAEPKDSIEVITLANHSHIDLQNLQSAGWWGNNEIVASVTEGTWIYTLQGKPVSQIGFVNTPWMYQGALS